MNVPVRPPKVLAIILAGGALSGGCSGLSAVRAPAQPTRNFPRSWDAAPEASPAPSTPAPAPKTFDNVADE